MSDDSTSKPDPSEATAPDTGAADAAAREAKRLKKEKKRQQRAIDYELRQAEAARRRQEARTAVQIAGGAAP